MGKKVILVGAKGQLGSIIRNKAPSHITLVPFTSAELDITNKGELRRAIAEIEPSVIINAAAYTQVDKAETESEVAFAVNSKGPENIGETAHGNVRVIHFSTDFVFSGRGKTPYKPEDATEPLGVYGKSKQAGEDHLLALKPDSSVIIRTAWLYSAFGKNFLNTMLFLMANKDEISVVADQKGTPTSAHTLAKVAWRFVDNEDASGIYHWTDKGEATWYEFACAIQEEALGLGLLNRKIGIKPITTAEYPTPAQRPNYSVLDKTKTVKALSFEGKPWREELEAVLRQI